MGEKMNEEYKKVILNLIDMCCGIENMPDSVFNSDSYNTEWYELVQIHEKIFMMICFFERELGQQFNTFKQEWEPIKKCPKCGIFSSKHDIKTGLCQQCEEENFIENGFITSYKYKHGY
jgi:hypothetical protein